MFPARASRVCNKAYSYDADSNRTGLITNTGTANYTYDTTTPSNRLMTVSGLMSRTNSYDANGSLTGDGTRSYGYDARGRLSSSTVGGVTTTYAVNGLGQRVAKRGPGVLPGGSRTYIYDEAGHMVGEYDSLYGSQVHETVWLGDLPVALLMLSGEGGSLKYYIHPDTLGAPKVIMDRTKAVVWNWEHDPFGNGQPTGTLSYNLRYPGQYYDTETGLSYNYYRDYDPALGRYVQSDPIGLKGGVNTYGYVGANPVNAVDPLGLWEGLFPSQGPVWHHGRNKYQSCPAKSPANDNVCTKTDNWQYEGKSPLHGNNNSYRGVGKNWHYQCVYDDSGNLVTDREFEGTYDYSPPQDMTGKLSMAGVLGHFGTDVIPWILYGN